MVLLLAVPRQLIFKAALLVLETAQMLTMTAAQKAFKLNSKKIKTDEQESKTNLTLTRL